MKPIEKFLAFLRTQKGWRNGFSSSQLYTFGREQGLKFREIAENFVQPKLKVGRGLYCLPDAIFEGAKPVAAKKAAKPTKQAKEKPSKKTLKTIEKNIVPKGLIESGKVIVGKFGVLRDDEDGYEWVASPEEIASTEDLHKTNY